MLKHDHNIFSLFSLISVDLTDEYNDKINNSNDFCFENRTISPKVFNEILTQTDNDNASSTSSMDSEDLKDLEDLENLENLEKKILD